MSGSSFPPLTPCLRQVVLYSHIPNLECPEDLVRTPSCRMGVCYLSCGPSRKRVFLLTDYRREKMYVMSRNRFCARISTKLEAEYCDFAKSPPEVV